MQRVSADDVYAATVDLLEGMAAGTKAEAASR
jgi:hypothetical protein